MHIEAVDLFCGAGGLTAGLLRAGVTVKAGYDIEPACEFAFSHNNKAVFQCKDVAEVSSEEIANWYSPNAIRLLAGCAPCQPFSSYNQGKDTRDDRKWPLLYNFARLIRETQPELVTMENVPDVTKHQVYSDFINNLTKLGYQIWEDTVVCQDYGLPQGRKRRVLLASRLNAPLKMIQPTHLSPRTVRDVIGHLPSLKAGESDTQDSLHRAAKLSDLNMQRIKVSKAGGTWRDWPSHLIADCHQKLSGKTYPSVYGRMEWDKPAPTMTTLCYGFGNGRFGHPEQNRAISLREAALIQDFPSDYKFVPDGSVVPFRAVGRMIGNAVPVRLGEIIGQSLLIHLKNLNRQEVK